MNGNVGYQPIVESKDDRRALPSFLGENPRYVVGNGTFKKVPLLTGVTRDETANAIEIKNIEKIFSSTTNFLESVSKSLTKSGLVGNVVGKLLPGVGENLLINDIYMYSFESNLLFCSSKEKALSLPEYLKVSDKLNLMQVLSKLTEATTDALFNLPAILTSQTWTKVAPAYLYSFEHVGKSSTRGSTFLSGLPIVGNAKPTNNTVAHGDELAYLFDARDIFGKAVQNNKQLDQTDKKVRDIFSNLIKTFAYMNSEKGAKNKGAFQEFKSEQSNFIRIGQEATVDKDFR